MSYCTELRQEWQRASLVLLLRSVRQAHHPPLAPRQHPAGASRQTVQHTKFGEGMIVNIESSGADARVQVNFRNMGTKWLALEYAKLTAVL